MASCSTESTGRAKTVSIRESAWNGTATTWRVSNSAIGSAKPNSPLIAVVSDPADYPIVSANLPQDLDNS